MSRRDQAMKRVVACCGLLTVLCWPAFADTPIPDREKMEVANAQFWQNVIPVASNAPGRFGAHYKTRVVIFNPTSRDYTITARLYGANGPVSRKDISIDSGRYLFWDNFLGDVFNYTGGGAVWLRAPGEDDEFYMTAEVYTDSSNGRFSTTVVNGIIPAPVTSTEPDFNVGITVNDSRRTNIGALNWDTKPSSVEAKVFGPSGTLLQTIGFELKSEAWQQKSIDTPVENGYVRWEINGESETHYFYAVEVDNASNDGTLNWSVQGSMAPGGGSQAPDLVVQSPSVNDPAPETGESFTFRATVRNRGDGQSAATTLRYYRSSNATISRRDTRVGTDAVGGSTMAAPATSRFD